jgi:3-dehydroquinate synthetase
MTDYLALLAGSSEVIPIALDSGEHLKTPTVWWSLMERAALAMEQAAVGRKLGIVAIGGGALGDAVGLIAQLLGRGVPLLMVPTSWLAMIDSAMGGKYAVNVGGRKNLCGIVRQPDWILYDRGWLDSLPQAMLVDGMGEMLKYALLQSTDSLDRWLSALPLMLARHPEALAWGLARAREEKMRLVQTDPMDGDPRESLGLRESLDGAAKDHAGPSRGWLGLGHSMAHALESLSSEWVRPLRHGEAVALGVCWSCHIAHEVLGTDIGLLEMASQWLEIMGLGLKQRPWEARLSPSSVVHWMRSDKKNSEGRLQILLPRGIGNIEIFFTTPDHLEELLRRIPWFYFSAS